MNRLAAKLVDSLTAKLVVVNSVKLHLTKSKKRGKKTLAKSESWNGPLKCFKMKKRKKHLGQESNTDHLNVSHLLDSCAKSPNIN